MRASTFTARTVLAQVQTCVEQRDAEPFQRGMNGDAPMEFAVCLGAGRCMIVNPNVQANVKTCPFCQWYPNDRGSGKPYRIDQFVANHLNGN